MKYALSRRLTLNRRQMVLQTIALRRQTDQVGLVHIHIGHKFAGQRSVGLARFQPHEYGYCAKASTNWSCHSPGTPFSAWIPRSVNRKPDRATNSRTASETTISFAAATAMTRAATTTFTPLTFSPRRPHSPA